MRKYSFIFKPAFFIFNLLFASWLVLKIEQIEPSNYEKYEKISAAEEEKNSENIDRENLLKLIDDYKKGKIDSTRFTNKLNDILDDAEE